MKHPTSEEWMAYLYEDSPDGPETMRADAEAHLAVCPECRRQVAEWRATLGLLDEDRVRIPDAPLGIQPVIGAHRDVGAPQRTASGHWTPWLPWALAAGVAVSASFMVGRAWGPSRQEFDREITQLRSELRREIAADLRAEQQQEMSNMVAATVKAATAGQQELAASLVAGFNEARRTDRRDLLSVLERMDQRRVEDLGQLRATVQSLAEQTGGAFQETGSRINALASVLPVRGGMDTP